jgi:uncharacterized protein
VAGTATRWSIMTETEIRIRVASSLAEVSPEAWDACANPGVTAEAGEAGEPHNPFLSHAFLHALEVSKSVGGRTGWSPVHLLIDEGGTLAAAVPAYLKTHSQGEYVFDWGWADAFHRAGGEYYPKVQVSIPFTPATGRRLLVRPGPDEARLRKALVAGLEALRDKTDASSVHLTFLPRDEWEMLGQNGFLQRTDQQFHFQNAGYGTFEDFLGALASRKRKMIRRERTEALAPGITIEWVTGRDITEAHWDAFWTFYMDTGSRKWGRPYLTRPFFSLIGQSMADRILLVMAKRNGRYIAGAINFIGDAALYGRNWGCIEHHPFLHFEVCYYQAIEYAITHKRHRVEAGAQGEHKLARGYGPVETYSAHRIADPRLARAVADFLKQERRHVASAIEAYGEHTPFRHED